MLGNGRLRQWEFVYDVAAYTDIFRRQKLQDRNARRMTKRFCQIGQPVALRHRSGAALRLCASARMASRCWSRQLSVPDAVAPELIAVAAIIEKMEWLMDKPRILEEFRS